MINLLQKTIFFIYLISIILLTLSGEIDYGLIPFFLALILTGILIKKEIKGLKIVLLILSCFMILINIGTLINGLVGTAYDILLWTATIIFFSPLLKEKSKEESKVSYGFKYSFVLAFILIILMRSIPTAIQTNRKKQLRKIEEQNYYKFTEEELFNSINDYRESLGIRKINLDHSLCQDVQDGWKIIEETRYNKEEVSKWFEDWFKVHSKKEDISSKYESIGALFIFKAKTPNSAVGIWKTEDGGQSLLEDKNIHAGCAYVKDGTGLVILATEKRK